MPALSFNDILQLLVTIRDERATHANTATRVGSAMIEMLRYLNESPYLRKDQPETVQYLLTLLAGAVIGESRQITLNPDGSITCGSIHVQGSAIFDELVVNRQTVNEGDQVYSNRGIIERVEHTDAGRYRIIFRKEHDNDRTTFLPNDCLKCRMNNLDREGTYFTSWFRVLTVDYDANSADVILYPDSEVPGGRNYPPVEHAVVSRWGNAVDKERQQSFYLSATDGTFCFLQGVTKPIIDTELDGNSTVAFIGLPPDIPQIQQLVKEGTIAPDETVVYAKTLLYEKLIPVQIGGPRHFTVREWAEWQPDKQYIRDWDEDAGEYMQDAVWWGGSLWWCIVKAARIGVEPALTNSDWACVRSALLQLTIESSEGDWFRAGTDWETTLVAMLEHGSLIISEDDIESVVWTRESDDAEGDNAWNINQAKRQQHMQLHITSAADIPQPWTWNSKVGFRCTVRVADRLITNSYDITQ